MAVKSDEYYKEEINKIEGYKLIKVIRKNDTLLNGDKVKDTKVRVKHEYCDNVYDVRPESIFRRNNRCTNCCGSYENSFAQHIEVELGLDINDVWDFEKNTVNPYHIYKGTHTKVWVKCQDTDYHGSYEVNVSNFVRGSGCSYCNPTGSNPKIHHKDSFAQYHIDNTDPNFLEKYWDYDKNTFDPWKISVSNDKWIWIKCQNEEVNELNGLMKKDYHDSYKIKTKHFTSGTRCCYCKANKVHPYDSFGYYNLDKVMSWHPDNKISPFRVAKCSGKKYKFMCCECGHKWNASTNHINHGRWCPQCNRSKGEKKVKAWLDYNNINYIHDEPYFNDLLSDLGNPLRPDFILPDYKIWIEYDGEFHYKNMTGTLVINKEHDKRKNDYAKLNNWKLIRIPYWDFFNVEKILEKEINKTLLTKRAPL